MNRLLNEEYESLSRAEKAMGKYIKIDGKWLLDTSMGSGTHFFGHGALTPIIMKALKNGSLYTVPNKTADICAELLHKATGFNSFVFCNSGSEATLRCIRIARAFTNRTKIALFEGCWHGTHDWNLALYSEGIPQSVKDMVVLLPLTNEGLNRLAENDIAIAMIEPVQSSLPINRETFLKNLKTACIASNTVLCFDEVISGFRMGLGGASQFYNIEPDMVAYGKTIGGGLPIGAIGGNNIMGIIKKGRGVRMGGTFSANPVAMAACEEVLKRLLRNDPYKNLHRIMADLNGIKSDTLQIISLGGMARLLFTGKKITNINERNSNELALDTQKKIKKELTKKGIFIAGNNALLFSVKHTSKDVKLLKKEIESIKL